jgi:hypothetical protein
VAGEAIGRPVPAGEISDDHRHRESGAISSFGDLESPPNGAGAGSVARQESVALFTASCRALSSTTSRC